MKQPIEKKNQLKEVVPVLYQLMEEMKGDPTLHKFVVSSRHQTHLYPTGVFYKPLSKLVLTDGDTH